ncbi:DUF6600 domain-containing protein [Sorangium sp. So ce1036]|uniref:DUF6600 domain-containing protein n=1 Tax=Sorangium sp. So ce1036 TaxID=3133328 RepID=UPI003F10CB22
MMLSMPLPLSAPPSRPAPAGVPGITRARLCRLGCALLLLAALVAAPSTGAAQGLPQGYTTDDPPAAGETAPSQPVEARPVQVEVGVSAEISVDAYADTDPSALIEFERPLAPYGTWVDDPTYGRVWVPSVVVVGPDFAPYQTAGRWTLTDEGEWLWVSDYAWGYIPFHYGRWVWTSTHRWAWIPGRVYAPAWVVWRVGDHGYVGWAPMPPTYVWRSGVAVSLWTVPPAPYVFCPTTHVFHRHIHRHVVRDRAIVRRIAAHSHTYRPARPTASAPARIGARPGRPDGARDAAPHRLRPGSYRPASPSLAEARVPASAAPRHRGKPDARALAYARKSTTPHARTLPPPARRFTAPPAPGGKRREAPSLRTPRMPGSQAPAPAARPAAPAHGLHNAGAPPRPGASAPHRAPRTVTAPPARPAAPRVAPSPRAVPERSQPAPAHPAPPPAAPRPKLSAPPAKPRFTPVAPPSHERRRIHRPSSPPPGRTAPAPSRPRSR